VSNNSDGSNMGHDSGGYRRTQQQAQPAAGAAARGRGRSWRERTGVDGRAVARARWQQQAQGCGRGQGGQGLTVNAARAHERAELRQWLRQPGNMNDDRNRGIHEVLTSKLVEREEAAVATDRWR
jgi:hypothetical protein